MKFSVFATDEESEENGKWFEFGEGARIKLRSFQSKKSQDVRAKLEEPYLPLKRIGRSIEDADMETILIRQIAQAIIADWEGFTEEDENGKEIAVKYSPKTAYDMLVKYREFRNAVARLVTDDDSFRIANKAEAEKN